MINTQSINWKWAGIGIFCLILIWAISLWAAFYWGGLTRKLDVLPLALPHAFALSEADLPKDYYLLQDITLLQELGMERNPDYVTNLSEMSALALRGGHCSFAAIYGRENVPALMLNGVFFRNTEHGDAFIEKQKNKDLLLAAYRKKVKNGLWVFFIACDSELTYADAEHHQISLALKKHAQKFNLEELFNHMPQTNDE